LSRKFAQIQASSEEIEISSGIYLVAALAMMSDSSCHDAGIGPECVDLHATNSAVSKDHGRSKYNPIIASSISEQRIFKLVELKAVTIEPVIGPALELHT
jgi:hypothetical protein